MSLGRYIYAQHDQAVVHLFASGNAAFEIAASAVTVEPQPTRYPWDGTVDLIVNTKQPTTFRLSTRIPGWCRSHAHGQ
jgi:uncharacterized protein